MNLFVALPLYLLFRPDPHVHTVATVERMTAVDNKIPITGQCQALVAESHEEALQKLIEAVTTELAHVPRNLGTTMSSFSLGFSIQEVVEGRFWGGSGCSSTTRLPDPPPVVVG